MRNLFAPWVWFDAGRDTNVFGRVRKVLDLQQVPETVELLITCSGHYRLWINGQEVGRGPSSSMPHHKRYDEFDVAGFLQTGANVIAVQLIHYGYEIAPQQTPSEFGGFWCQLSGGDLRCGTDESWRMSIDPCYNPDTVQRNVNYGIMEIYDARRDEAWRDRDYDDRHWHEARPWVHPWQQDIPGPQLRPWECLIPRGMPQCREEVLRPSAVVRTAEVENLAHAPAPKTLAERIMWEVPEEPTVTRIDHADRLLDPHSDQAAIVHQPSPHDPEARLSRISTIMLDFGKEITGYVWIDVEGAAGTIIDITCAERMIGGRVPARIGGPLYLDRYIMRDGRQRHQVYDWKGFRYIQLTIRDMFAPLHIHGVGATFTSYPVDYRGSLVTADPQLDEIWRVGAYSQQLCMHDRLMDTPWREQIEWLGDGRIQLLVIQNAFGDAAMPRNFIENFTHSQLPSGMIPCKAFHPEHYIVDYALWWVQGIVDVALFDGDTAFAVARLNEVERLLRWFEPHIDERGQLGAAPGWVFIDHANIGKTGTCAPLNAVLVIALDAAIQIAGWADARYLVERWTAQVDRLRASYHEVFWDAEAKYYRDNLEYGQATGRFSQHTQALAVLAGVNRVDAGDLMRRAMKDPSITHVEPYCAYYLLEALGATGCTQEALDYIRERWGRMLDEGATSTWEEWQVTATHRLGRWLARPRSHCHAWSAGPTAWLSRRLLGVRVECIDGPIVIAPQPCDLRQARGTVPTVYGDVTIAWHQCDDGSLSVDVDVPIDAEVAFEEPAAFAGTTTVTVNQREQQHDEPAGIGS